MSPSETSSNRNLHAVKCYVPSQLPELNLRRRSCRSGHRSPVEQPGPDDPVVYEQAGTVSSIQFIRDPTGKLVYYGGDNGHQIIFKRYR